MGRHKKVQENCWNCKHAEQFSNHSVICQNDELRETIISREWTGGVESPDNFVCCYFEPNKEKHYDSQA